MSGFGSMSRWHPGDPPARSCYPHRLRLRDRAGAAGGAAGPPQPPAAAGARRRCCICEAHPAELVTHDDPLAPTNPCIMCRCVCARRPLGMWRAHP